MCKETHKQNILKSLSRKLGDDFSLSIQSYMKTNEKLDGLVILKECENISPIIYLDSFYKDLEKGRALDDVIQEIFQTYFQTRLYPSKIDTSSISNYEIVKNRLYVALINKHLNKDLLQDIPHTYFLDDFAVVVYCLIELSADSSSSFLIRNEHLKMWELDQKTLISHAMQNTQKLMGLEIIPIRNNWKNASNESNGTASRETLMWIMTNRLHLSGAATILFDDALKTFVSTQSGNFFVIFSSIHEILLIPTLDDTDLAFMTEVNQSVNAETLPKDEILGTKAYYYTKEHGFYNCKDML